MKPDTPPTRATGWLPHPVLSALLGAVWLLLQQSLAPAQLIAAVLIGIGVPKLVRAFLVTGPARPGARGAARRAAVALRLTGIVLFDIVVSNLVVARLVLGPGATPRPAWIRVPLVLEDPVAITLLATIITTTPGTVSCVVDETRREIVVHALDCDDAAAMAAQIKERYEAPLKEILG